MNAAGLTGNQAMVEIATTQEGQEATVMLVTTTGSSTLSGFFTLTMEGHTTEPLPFDASGEEMKLALQALESIGTVLVERTSTGVRDDNSWGVQGGYTVYGTPPLDELHFEAVYPLFVYNLSTYNWLVTLTSRSGAVPLLTACCDEINSEEASSVTLRSALSSDSQLTVTYVTEGSTENLYGNIALIIDGVQSSSFFINSTALVVQQAITALGYNTTVTRLPIDYNGLYSYRVYFDDYKMPIIDAYLSPSLSPQTNEIFPTYTRQGVLFDWEYSLPVHNIQLISTPIALTGSVTCTVLAISVTFQASDIDSVVQTAFNLNTIYGSVIVSSNITQNSSATTIERYVIYTDYLSSLGSITCDNSATVTVVQDGALAALGGSFKIGREVAGSYNYSIDVSTTATTSEIQAAVSSLFDGASMDVTAGVATTTELSWTVTFSGSTVGGDIPLLSVMSNLTGTNSYALSEDVVQGSQPNGSVVLSYGARNISLPVLSEDFFIRDELAALLTGTRDLIVLAYGPTGDGSLSWMISYFLTAPPLSNLTVTSGEGFSGLGAQVHLSLQQNGTTPLGGSFNLSVIDPITNVTLTKPFNVSVTEEELYYQLQALSSTVFDDCEVVQHSDNINSMTFRWTVTLAYGLTTRYASFNP